MGIELDGVEITVDGDFPARGAGSTPTAVDLRIRTSAPEADVRALVAEVGRMAEIPRAIREGPPIKLNASVIARSNA